MKQIKSLYLLIILPVFLLITACTKTERSPMPDELDNYQLASILENEHHTISLFTATGKFQTGYNSIYLQIKNADGILLKNAEITWTPTMSMMHMEHSCPHSTITLKNDSESTYKGYIVFQMASNDMEQWELSVNYSIGDSSYTAHSIIDVVESSSRQVETFVGNDSNNYVLALVAPQNPIVGINDIQVLLYEMESMMSYTPVKDFTIFIDPRMPGMGNHSSPYNTPLYNSDSLYEGKLNLTMTGYWKINLQVENEHSEIIKGTEVTETVESSDIYFEIEL